MAWLSTHTHRKAITVQDTNVDSNLTDFPCYVDITADVEIGDGALATGYDIRFTQSDGTTLLKYEREYWTGGAGGDATGHFWVKVPSILSTGGATIYCYYGDADASDGEDAANVWDSNFKAVWHLNESSGDAIDSIGNHDGTFNGALPDPVAGQVHNGQDFTSGDSDYISRADHADLDFDGEFTVEAWANPDSTDAMGRLLYKYAFTPDYGWTLTQHSAGSGLWAFVWTINGASVNCLSDAAPSGSMQYIAVTRDSGDTLTLYVDAAAQADTENDSGDSGNTGALAIGSDEAGGGNFFDGIIDEVRISHTERNAAWLKFTEANMDEADNELTWGAQQRIMRTDAGVYAITGATLAPKHDKKVATTAGTYAITGAAMAPTHDKKIAAAAGSYAITGAAMSPLHDKKLACDGGTYVITGAAASLTYSTGAAIGGDQWHMFQMMSQN